MGCRTVSTLVRAMYWLHLIYGSPVWGRLRKERRCAVTQRSLAAHRCLFSMGPRYGRRARSVNRLRWLRIVDIRALWRPGFLQQFLWMVSADPIIVWGEYANPLTTWFLEVAHYVDGTRWSQSLVGDVSTTEYCCVWHIETSGAICRPQDGLHTHCPFSVDDGEALASYFYWNDVFLQCSAYTWLQTFRCVVKLNPTSEDVPFWINSVKAT